MLPRAARTLLWLVVGPHELAHWIAVLIDAAVDPGGGAVAVAGGVVLALWAAPSHGDLTVFLRAPAVKAGGSFDVEGPVPPGAYALSALLTLLSTAVVVGLFAT